MLGGSSYRAGFFSGCFFSVAFSVQLFSWSAPVQAQVTPGGLGTAVNGSRSQGCSDGICAITGGTDAGINRFHRLRNFDTRGLVQGVHIDSGNQKNIILGVTAPIGSFIDKSVKLSSPAHLFLLSPGGIHLGAGAGFLNSPQLTLSTASQLRFPGGLFDVSTSTPDQLSPLIVDPLPGSYGLLNPSARHGSGELRGAGIYLDGIDIRIADDLLVDAPGGLVHATDSRLSVGNDKGLGGYLTVTGEVIHINEATQLIASGPEGGGSIQIGGSWQNSNPSVRQAISTNLENGSILDASGFDRGDGGQVVIWSDIHNPRSSTSANGQVSALPGIGGIGGRVETSGYHIDLTDIDVKVSTAESIGGDWLIDPNAYLIRSTEAAAIKSYLEQVDGSGNSLGQNLTISVANDVASYGSVGDVGASANIRVQDPISAGGSGRLTLDACSSTSGTCSNSGGIILAADVTRTQGGDLRLVAGSGVSGSGNIRLTSVAGYDPTLTIEQYGDTSYAGSIYLSGELAKEGTGSLQLTAGTQTGIGPGKIRVDAGHLELGYTSSRLLEIASGATVQFNDAVKSRALPVFVNPTGQTGGTVTLPASSTSYWVSSTPTEDVEFSGSIVGPSTSSIQKYGQFDYRLSGDNGGFLGGLYIGNGSITAAHSNALGSSSAVATISSQGALRLTGGVDIPAEISLANGKLYSVGGVNNVSKTISNNGGGIYVTGGSLTIDQGVAGNYSVSPSTGSKDLLVNASAGTSLTFTDGLNLGPAGVLSVYGDGEVIVASESTMYTKNLIGSTLTASATNALGASGNIWFSGGTLKLTTAATDYSSRLKSNSTLNGYKINAATDLVLSSPLSGTNVPFTKTGSGKVSFSAANTFSGDLEINQGDVEIAAGGSLAPSVDVVISAPGRLLVPGDHAFGSLSGSGNVVLSNSSSLTIGANDSNTVYSGEISGVGNVIKTGLGTFDIQSSQAWSGSLQANQGTTRLSNSGDLPSTVSLAVASPGSFSLTTGKTLSLGSISGDGSVSLATRMDILKVGGDNTSTTYSGSMSGMGTLEKIGSGTLELSGTNTFGMNTPVITISGGVLKTSNDNSLGSAQGDGSILIKNGSTLMFTAGVTLDATRGIELGSGGGKLSVASASDTVTIPSALTGSGALTKTGPGVVLLTNNNTSFSGLATVSAGTLTVNGANPTSASVSCAGGSSNHCVSAPTSSSGSSGGSSSSSSSTTSTESPVTSTGDSVVADADSEVSSSTHADSAEDDRSASTETSVTSDTTDAVLAEVLDVVAVVDSQVLSETPAFSAVTTTSASSTISSDSAFSTPVSDSSTSSTTDVATSIGSGQSDEAIMQSVSLGQAVSVQGVDISLGESFSLSEPSSDTNARTSSGAVQVSSTSTADSSGTTTTNIAGSSDTATSNPADTPTTDSSDSGSNNTSTTGDTQPSEASSANEAEAGGTEGSPESASVAAGPGQTGPSTIKATVIPQTELSPRLTAADAASTSRVVQNLNLPELGIRKTPTISQMQNSLRSVRSFIGSSR